MFRNCTDEFVLELLQTNFNTILEVSDMGGKLDKAKNAKCASPAAAVGTNIMFFILAFREGESRGILSPAEISMGNEIADNFDKG